MAGIVFLVADIGIGENGYLHIGDEAMWFANVERYQKIGWQIISTSRALRDTPPDVNLIQDTTINTPEDFFKSITKPNEEQVRIINEVNRSEVVHISGGGNINSLWPGHLYFRLFVIHWANKLGKRVITTGQTIGPLSKDHKILARKVLSKVDKIAVRDTEMSVQILKELRIPRSNIHSIADDAISTSKLLRNNNQIKESYIGLSLHNEYCNNSLIENFIHENFSNLQIRKIPHILYQNNDEMGKCTIGNSVVDLRLSVTNIELTINNSIYETQNASLNIVSRYHAAVFSLMAGVPTICIYDNEYYKAKLDGILDAFHRPTNAILLNLKTLSNSIDLQGLSLQLENTFEIVNTIDNATQDYIKDSLQINEKANPFY